MNFNIKRWGRWGKGNTTFEINNNNSSAGGRCGGSCGADSWEAAGWGASWRGFLGNAWLGIMSNEVRSRGCRQTLRVGSIGWVWWGRSEFTGRWVKVTCGHNGESGTWTLRCWGTSGWAFTGASWNSGSTSSLYCKCAYRWWWWDFTGRSVNCVYHVGVNYNHLGVAGYLTGKTLSNIHLHLCRNRCGDHLVVSGKILGLVDDHVEVSEIVNISNVVDAHHVGDYLDYNIPGAFPVALYIYCLI